MDMQNVYVVHYHEIALKGRNRPMFLRQLQENICRTVVLKKSAVRIVEGRLLVLSAQAGIHDYMDPRFRGDDSSYKLSQVFGISSFSSAVLVTATYGEIENAIYQIVGSGLVPGRNGGAQGPALPPVWNSFAIHAVRGDKKFPMTSKEIEIKLGDFVRVRFKKKVDLEHPDVTFYVEIFSGGALVYTQKISGPGGLPLGTQPKVTVLLSGGIDSPVAAYRIMKRGTPIVAIHFHSYPFTSRASIDKVKELVRILGQYHGGRPVLLYLVPLTDAQKQIVQKCSERYRVLLYRRLMWRIAQEIAHKEKAQALVSGESLGQVASQTLENLAVVEAVLCATPNLSSKSRGNDSLPPSFQGGDKGVVRDSDGVGAALPILRPLIGYDKEEIIGEAKKIGTYDLSIQPHDDCCTLFMPRQVATKARVEDLEREEGKLDIENLVQLCLKSTSWQRQSVI